MYLQTILVVDDEALLRGLTCNVLARNGYRVLEAVDGQHALEIAAEFPEPIDLLLTDVLMPRLRGDDLARQLTAARPKLSVIYMSGDVGCAVFSDLGGAKQLFLQKPFSLDDLLAGVQHVLQASLPALSVPPS